MSKHISHCDEVCWRFVLDKASEIKENVINDEDAFEVPLKRFVALEISNNEKIPRFFSSNFFICEVIVRDSINKGKSIKVQDCGNLFYELSKKLSKWIFLVESSIGRWLAALFHLNCEMNFISIRSTSQKLMSWRRQQQKCIRCHSSIYWIFWPWKKLRNQFQMRRKKWCFEKVVIIKHFVPLNKNFPHNFLALKIITYKKMYDKRKVKERYFYNDWR